MADQEVNPIAALKAGIEAMVMELGPWPSPLDDWILNPPDSKESSFQNIAKITIDKKLLEQRILERLNQSFKLENLNPVTVKVDLLLKESQVLRTIVHIPGGFIPDEQSGDVIRMKDLDCYVDKDMVFFLKSCRDHDQDQLHWLTERFYLEIENTLIAVITPELPKELLLSKKDE